MIRKHELTEDVLKDKKLVLFGSGRDAWKIISIESRRSKIAYICDNSSGKWGTDLEGIPILPPSKLLEEDRNSVIVIIATMIYRHEIIPWLVSNGLTYCMLDEILNKSVFTDKSKAKTARRIFALITGNVRNYYSMSATFHMLLKHRNNGTIEGIVWSTWIGEPDKIPGLRDKLTACGICIIETPLPQALNTVTAQLTQVYKGLIPIPDDAWVIRLRTDGTVGYFTQILSVLCKEQDLSIKKVGLFPQILSHKIICSSYACMSCLFNLDDMAFAAMKNDMVKMCGNLDAICLNGISLSPETTFYGNPFFGVFPVLIDYFRFFSQYIKHVGTDNIPVKRLMSLTERMILNINEKDTFSFPAALNKAFAVIIPIYYSSFHFVEPTDDYLYNPTHFADIFSYSNENHKRIPRLDFINGYMENIINWRIIPSTGYMKFNSEFQCVISDPAYALSLRINNSDYNEATEILSKQGINPKIVDNTFTSTFPDKPEGDSLSMFEPLLSFLSEKEREQLISFYNDNLELPYYQERLFCAIENDSEILPRVLYALVLTTDLRDKKLMLLMNAFPKTYMRFAMYTANSVHDDIDESGFLYFLLHHNVNTASIANEFVDAVVKNKVLTFEHLIAHYHMLKYFERHKEKYPAYDVYYSVIIRRFREFIGVTEQQCPNCETYHETARNIALYKLRTDEKWRHAELFRKAIDEITEK